MDKIRTAEVQTDVRLSCAESPPDAASSPVVWVAGCADVHASCSKAHKIRLDTAIRGRMHAGLLLTDRPPLPLPPTTLATGPASKGRLADLSGT